MTTTTLIVDASVAIKWYVPEVHTDIAQRLVEESWTLHAPELIFIEIGNIAWKQVRFGGATVADAIDIVHAALEVGIEVHRSSYLLGRALEIGLATQRTVYDSLYVALSEQIGAPVITADERLYKILKDGPFASNALWIEHLPACPD